MYTIEWPYVLAKSPATAVLTFWHTSSNRYEHCWLRNHALGLEHKVLTVVCSIGYTHPVRTQIRKATNMKVRAKSTNELYSSQRPHPVQARLQEHLQLTIKDDR